MPADRPAQAKRWTVAQIDALFGLPFNDLLYRAQQVHRGHFDPNAIQRSTLLSIKTGGCSEDCGYCSQAARYNTGLERDELLPLDEVLAAAQATFGSLPTGEENTLTEPAWVGGVASKRLVGSSQTHVVIGYPIGALVDDDPVGPIAAAVLGAGVPKARPDLAQRHRPRDGLELAARLGPDAAQRREEPPRVVRAFEVAIHLPAEAPARDGVRRIAADGEIIEGTGSVNESMLTGEALPVDKQSGDQVTGGTKHTWLLYTTPNPTKRNSSRMPSFFLKKTNKYHTNTILIQ